MTVARTVTPASAPHRFQGMTPEDKVGLTPT